MKITTKLKETEIGLIPEDWEINLLENIGNIKNGKFADADIFKGNVFQVIGANGVIGKSDYFNTLEDSIIIGRVGANCGNVFFTDKKCWVTDNALILNNNDNYCSKFLYYYLSSIKLNKLRHGTSKPLLNQRILNKIIVPNPTLKEQIKIAEVLDSLDKKISVNNKINSILEQISQALFKHWFIDFEFPDEHGRPYKSSGGEFVDSELGKIPKGWEIASLGTLITFNKGKKPLETSAIRIKEFLPLILIERLRNNFGEYASAEKMQLVNSDDVIMIMDGASSSEVFIGYEGVLGSTIGAFKPKDKNILSPYFLYYFLKINFEYLKNNNFGAAIPHANKDVINRLVLVLPKKTLMDIFHKQCLDVYKLIINLRKENENLSHIRDTLLPKLITGKIRVNLEDISEG